MPLGKRRGPRSVGSAPEPIQRRVYLSDDLLDTIIMALEDEKIAYAGCDQYGFGTACATMLAEKKRRESLKKKG